MALSVEFLILGNIPRGLQSGQRNRLFVANAPKQVTEVCQLLHCLFCLHLIEVKLSLETLGVQRQQNVSRMYKIIIMHFNGGNKSGYSRDNRTALGGGGSHAAGFLNRDIHVNNRKRN